MSIVLTAGQDEMVRLGEAWFTKQDKQVFRAFGYAGCLDKNSLILTDKGTMTLEELILHQRNDLDFLGFESFDKDLKVYNGYKFTEISDIYATDIMDGYEITTKGGKKLLCSNIHPLLTIGNEEKNYTWTKSSELKVGDQIGCLGNKNIYDKELTPSYTDEYFLGYYIADGYAVRNQLSFTSKKPERLHDLKKYLTGKFNVDCSIKLYGGYYRLHCNMTDDIRQLLQVVGLDVKNKKVNRLHIDTPEKKYNFLRGMINDIGIGKDDITFCNLHKSNVEYVQAVFAEFGIVFSNLKEKKHKLPDGRTCTAYQITLVKEFCIQLFKLFGNLIGSKSEYSLEEYVDVYNSGKNNTNVNIYNNLSEVCKDIENIHKIVGTVGYDYRRGSRRVSRDKLKILSEKTDNVFLHSLYDDGFFFDEIINIEKINQKFYDISVPDNNSFISNGIISHNTGKSTSINAMIAKLGIDPKAVAYATYTGKAALVLLRKGHGATTIHKLIYEPLEVKEKYTDPKDGEIKFKVTIKFKLKDNLPEDIKLLVLDECSMIDERIWDDLLTLNRPIIVLGDPGQLPPINGKSPVTAEKPDVMLTEVMRQAADNPIIYLSTLARQGKRIEYGDYGDGVYVVRRRDLEDYDYLDNDIIITTTNNTRDDVNNMMRELNGFRSPLPCVGDKIICRKNDWDTSLNGIPLVNGLIGDVINPVRPNEANSNLIDVDFRPDGFNKKFFEGVDINVDMISPTISAKERREIMADKYSPGHMFEYGYAITTHLSQGSQWENVLYLYQGFGDATMRKQLLYTGITRAEKGLTLVL